MTTPALAPNSHHEVLLCNFGGPTQQTEVEPFLRRLFDDPLVIKIPDFIRPVLARRIAKKRAPNSSEEYAHIGYSPINKMTQAQASQLEGLLRQDHPNTDVHVVNRYTAPFADEVIPKLKLDGRLFVLTMYPHFCHSTTATSVREVDRALLARLGSQEADSTRIYSWWHNQKYLDYSTQKLQDKLQEVLDTQPDGPITVMFSAHGIPKRYRDRGDPYVSETTGHFNEIKRRVQSWLKDRPQDSARCHWELCFQSRVGPVEWTKPYTDATIDRLGPERGGHLLIYPISFTSDHIETLYEMDITYQTQAKERGFTSYHRVAGANDDLGLTQCLADILRSHGF